MFELYTTITRTDADGEPVELEAIVHFSATVAYRGRPECRNQRNGDPGWPAEPRELECSFESAELDPTYRQHGIAPLTDAELATLRAWFVTKGDQAQELANDNDEPDDGPDPDDARDRDFDDRDFWRGLEA